MHWLTRGLKFGGKLSCTGSLLARILVENVMYWLTRGLDFGGKLSCTGSLEAWILVENCHALAP